MTTQGNNGKIRIGHVDNALYAALAIPAVKVVFGGRESLDVITGIAMNGTLGYLAYQEGCSLSDLVALVREYGEKLPPNVESVAARVRVTGSKKDVPGLTFQRASEQEIKDAGKPYGRLAMKGVGVLVIFTSFQDAFQYFGERVNEAGYSAGTAIALLQEVLQADLPIMSPDDEGAQPRRLGTMLVVGQ